MKLQICCKNPETAEIEKIETEYDGALSAKVIKTFNRVFLKQAANGRFYPCDAMDCYHDVWLELNRKAERMEAGNTEGGDTYMIRCMLRMLLNWQRRKVRPQREQHRQRQRLETGKFGARGVDDFDVDNWNPVEEEPWIKRPGEWRESETEETRDIIREKGEELAADDDTTDRFIDHEQRSREKLGRLCEMLLKHGAEGAKIVRAFRLYVEFSGNLFAVANNMKIPKSSFYRRWERWLKFSKKIWEKRV